MKPIDYLLGRAVPKVQPKPLVSSLGGQPIPLLGPVSQYVNMLSTDIAYATEGTLLGLPAANRCVNLIANATAQMLAHGDVCTGSTKLADKPLIVERPNVFYGSYEYWYEAVATAVIHGNYLALITAVDDEGFAEQVTPIHPGQVTLSIESGYPVYQIGEHNYNWRQVVHVRGLTLPGSRWGVGVLEAHRRSIMGAYDEQTYATKSLENGGSPNLVIGLDTQHVPAQEELDRIKSQWTSTYSRGNREPAVLPKTMNITPVQWSPHEMDFLESRRFTIAEMAFMFNLDPTDLSASIGGQGTLNYQNSQSREVVRLLHSYGPWLHRFEDAWSDLLPEGQTFEGNVEAIMRMDTKTRYETHAIALQWMDKNEVRAIEGLEPREESMAPITINNDVEEYTNE